MTEREELQAALAAMPGATGILGVVCAAAEKHLATLPKVREQQRWLVTWAAKVSPRLGEGWETHCYLAESEERAQEMATARHNCGATVHPPITQLVPCE